MTRKDEDKLYDRARGQAMMACTIWPIAIAFLAPWLLDNLVLGFGLLVASIVQFLWVPDAFASWRTRHLKGR